MVEFLRREKPEKWKATEPRALDSISAASQEVPESLVVFPCIHDVWRAFGARCDTRHDQCGPQTADCALRENLNIIHYLTRHSVMLLFSSDQQPKCGGGHAFT